MAIGNFEVGIPKTLPASANIKSSQGALIGFYVNSTSSGTIQLYDDAGTGTTNPIGGAAGTITPVIGFSWLPITFTNGLYAVLGATINVTFIYA
jgi:hypothetical protein